jgi:hypothetical protein
LDGAALGGEILGGEILGGEILGGEILGGATFRATGDDKSEMRLRGSLGLPFELFIESTALDPVSCLAPNLRENPRFRPFPASNIT